MFSLIALLRSCSHPRALALASIAVAVAGCSADSTRFNDSPFASRASTGEVTGSVPARAPVSRVEQSQLPPPPGSQPAPIATAPVGVSGGGRGMASYAPASAPEYTGSVQPPPPPPVPVAHAPAARPLPPAPAPIAAVPAHTARTVATQAAGTHVVAPGETLSKISRRYGKSIADIAKANNIPPHATLKIGDRLVIPGMRTARAQPQPNALPNAKPPAKVAQAKPLGGPGTAPAAAPAAAPAPAAKPAPGMKPTAAAKQTQQVVASVDPAQSASIVTPVADATAATHTAKSADASPSFRWPVKGRVIAGYGPKTNGQQNDGINLAVPEGTPVKAAEDGVVAYAGSELKGYGNLVLVRHSNGYVTAYAHAKELMVKRGDTIKRGQVIAKSGQTGNVDTPQLHFEVRKGPSPLDPMPLLSGG
jgi:murein DD-endopeptidase MepM/ murein hydrolase activator NlpD